MKTSTLLKLLTGLAVLALAAALAVRTGLARQAFFELFALLKKEEILSPTVQRMRPLNSPYQRWLETARGEMPVFEGLVVDDVARIGLPPWPQLGEGVHGLYLRLADYQMTDGRLVEIPPQGSTVEQRHLYEKGIYIISGSGHTILQPEGRPEERVDWQAGDLFSIPLNMRHRHYNTGGQPARMLWVTSFPLMLNLLNEERFVLDNDSVFSDRYEKPGNRAEPARSTAVPEVIADFIEDVRTTATRPYDFQGRGNSTMRWLMAGNSVLAMHIVEMPPETHMKAHRHTSDAFILVLSGTGYSVTWKEGDYDDRVRVDWKPGTLFAPPTYWYHQHLNSGRIPARRLAINAPDVITNLGLDFEDQLETDKPEIIREWKEELRKIMQETPRD